MKNLSFILAILLSFNSVANSSFQQSKVSKIILHDYGSILISLQNGVITNESCSNKSAIILSPANQHYKEMYAALLAAYHAGSEVAGWVNSCDTKFDLPILTRLDLIPKG